jgi:1-acyl-sn-glycerol-3-phosphate acyltransferase
MAKEELFHFRPLGWWLTRVGTFAVRRGETDRAALRRAEELLRAGAVVMVFPEGHRSDSGGAQAARAGAVLLASRTKTPILPCGITGTEQLRTRSYLSRPRVVIRVGEPFMVGSGARGAERRAASEQLMRRVVALLPPRYHGIYADGES